MEKMEKPVSNSPFSPFYAIGPPPPGHFEVDFRCFFFYVPVAGGISSSLKYNIDNWFLISLHFDYWDLVYYI